MIKTLFLDMDGVLADFDGFYEKRFGYAPRDSRAFKCWKENWKIWMEEESFQKLPMLRGAMDIISAATGLVYDGKVKSLEILSSTANEESFLSASMQKTRWIKDRGLFPVFDSINFVKDWKIKVNYIESSSDVIIDDNYKLVRGFRMNGANAIFHNGNHEDVIWQLRELANKG